MKTGARRIRRVKKGMFVYNCPECSNAMTSLDSVAKSGVEENHRCSCHKCGNKFTVKFSDTDAYNR